MSQYSRVAIVLHWLIGLSIVAMLAFGLWIDEQLENPATREAAFNAVQLHKSFGLTILVLSLVRLAWRLTHRPPPLPATMKGWEIGLAHLTHWSFYLLMIGIPLSGWIMVSTSRLNSIPTIWFGLFQWPHVPGLATHPDRLAISDAAHEAHEVTAYLMIALLVLHVAAALKHHLVDRDDVLPRMLPWIGKRAG